MWTEWTKEIGPIRLIRPIFLPPLIPPKKKCDPHDLGFRGSFSGHAGLVTVCMYLSLDYDEDRSVIYMA